MQLNKLYPRPTWIDSEDDARDLVARIDQAQRCGCRPAVDTETTGLNIMSDVVVFWSVCYEYGSRYCLPAKLLPVFQPLFKERRRQWWFTNAKFDKHMLANSGVEFNGDMYCTLPADFLVDDTKSHGLKECTWRHFDERIMSFAQVFGIRGKKDVGETLKQFMYGGDPIKRARAIDYASGDAWQTFRLGAYLEDRLHEAGHWNFMPNIYVPMTRLLWDMEREGIEVDVEKMQALRGPLTEQISELEHEFARHAGRVCNMKSTHDLRRLFFGELGRQPKKLTKGGKGGNRQPALDSGVLEEWEDEGDTMAEILLKHRKATKLVSTYIDGLSEWLDSDNKIHCTFNTHIARTGRLSTSEPTLQNIPIRSELGPRFRECFCATGNHVLGCYDYSQLEQAVMAHFCQDPHMLSMVRDGKDIHAGSAAILYELRYEDIEAARAIKTGRSEEQEDLAKKRDDCKHIGFGLNYGMGKGRLARRLGVDQNTAADLRMKYLARFPKMNEFIKSQHAFVRKNFRVYTILGRPRRLWGALAGGKYRAFAERAAVNTPIQGTAADIVMKAMIRIHDDKRLRDLGVKILLQIHDELVFKMHKDAVDDAKPIIKELMEFDDPELNLTIPLRVDGGIGKNWRDAK